MDDLFDRAKYATPVAGSPYGSIAGSPRGGSIVGSFRDWGSIPGSPIPGSPRPFDTGSCFDRTEPGSPYSRPPASPYRPGSVAGSAFGSLASPTFGRRRIGGPRHTSLWEGDDGAASGRTDPMSPVGSMPASPVASLRGGSPFLSRRTNATAPLQSVHTVTSPDTTQAPLYSGDVRHELHQRQDPTPTVVHDPLRSYLRQGETQMSGPEEVLCRRATRSPRCSLPHSQRLQWPPQWRRRCSGRQRTPVTPTTPTPRTLMRYGCWMGSRTSVSAQTHH